jgi:bacillithiol synthase
VPNVLLPYAATGRFSNIVLDHLAGHTALAQHQQFPFTWAGLLAAASARRLGADARERLCTTIAAQYSGVEMPKAAAHSLQRLAQPTALTVTTGHQLCLFGGPLYVALKVLNTVRLARDLEQRTGRPVVPIFWMATEDHDREEVDHVVLQGTRVHWAGEAGGAVGRMPLVNIEGAVAEAMAVLEREPHAAHLRDLLERCYAPHHSLAQATRLFMNALFGTYGLLCLDGDDAELKRAVAPVFQEDVLNGIVQRTVDHAVQQWEGRYSPQAHAQAINLFHLSPGSRSRLEAQGDQYGTTDGHHRFSVEELVQRIAESTALSGPSTKRPCCPT